MQARVLEKEWVDGKHGLFKLPENEKPRFVCGQLDGAGQETMRRVDGRQAQALSKLPDN